ncbi:hypothetical protein [Billgrantia aerodenitrificans]|jgi:hypothetical protein|nr:hypothetical protein [Halomonas aerodenitrificans]
MATFPAPYSLRDRFAHAPEPSGVRRVFPNVSLHSYLPTQEPQNA